MLEITTPEISKSIYFGQQWEKIIFEIIDSFPTDMKKIDFGHMILGSCLKAIDHMDKSLIVSISTKKIRREINNLLQSIEIYRSEMKLWKPGEQ